MFNINLERIVCELNNIPCIEIEDYEEANKQIVSSRSFGELVDTREALMLSYIFHVEQAGRKMRKQGLFAKEMIVFANSNRFKDDYISCAIKVVFLQAIDSFRIMAKYLDKAVNELYKPGVKYKKSGIVLPELITLEHQGMDLFANSNICHDKLLPAIEDIKKQFGKASIGIAAAKLSDAWLMKSDLRSKNYTTDIDDLLTAN